MFTEHMIEDKVKTAISTTYAHSYRHILRMALALKYISATGTPGPVNPEDMALEKRTFLIGGWMLVWLTGTSRVFVTTGHSWSHENLARSCQGLTQIEKSHKDFIKHISLLSFRVSSQFSLFPSLWQYLLKHEPKREVFKMYVAQAPCFILGFTNRQATPRLPLSPTSLYNLNDLDIICQTGEMVFPFPQLYFAHRS